MEKEPGEVKPPDATKQKANEMAVDALKQLLTLASAILAVTITFVKDLLGQVEDTPHWAWLVQAAWALLVIVIWTAWIASADASKRVGLGASGYVFGGGTPKVLAKIAQWSFGLALLALAIFAIRNFNSLSTKRGGPQVSAPAASSTNLSNALPSAAPIPEATPPQPRQRCLETLDPGAARLKIEVLKASLTYVCIPRSYDTRKDTRKMATG